MDEEDVTPERGHFRFRLVFESLDGDTAQVIKECLIPISRIAQTVGEPISSAQLQSEIEQLRFKQACLMTCALIYTLTSLRWVLPHLAIHLEANYLPEEAPRV